MHGAIKNYLVCIIRIPCILMPEIPCMYTRNHVFNEMKSLSINEMKSLNYLESLELIRK